MPGRSSASAVVTLASLAVAFALAGPALAAPAVESNTSDCPRDLAVAEMVATSAPETVPSPAPQPPTSSIAEPEPEPVATVVAATVPAGASELDAQSTIDINAQPRDTLRPGGTLRLDVVALPANWNLNHVEGTSQDAATIREPIGYFPWLIDHRGAPTPNPDFVRDHTMSSDGLTSTFTLNPAAVWHSGQPITVADWQAQWNARNGLDPRFQAVDTAGYELIASVDQGADEFEVIVTFCEPYADYEALFSDMGPAEALSDPETFNSGWIGPPPNDWFTGPFEVA
jgi:peptide/nickel transport system substrate-binding protein